MLRSVVGHVIPASGRLVEGDIVMLSEFLCHGVGIGLGRWVLKELDLQLS